LDQLLYMMDEAFDAEGHEHSFLANVRSLKDDDWEWVPPGGARPIFEIVYHVGICKYVYDNHAFGDGSMRWNRPRSLPYVRRDASKEEVIAWVREGQRILRSSIDALESDEELLRLRRSNWEGAPTQCSSHGQRPSIIRDEINHVAPQQAATLGVGRQLPT
jgi:hypothetical protein